MLATCYSINNFNLMDDTQQSVRVCFSNKDQDD